MPHYHPTLPLLPLAHLFLSHGLCLLIMKRSQSPFDPEDTCPMIPLSTYFIDGTAVDSSAALVKLQHLCCCFGVDAALSFHCLPFCTMSYLTIHLLARNTSFPIAHLRRIEQLIKLKCFMLRNICDESKRLMEAHKLEAVTLAFRVPLKPASILRLSSQWFSRKMHH